MFNDLNLALLQPVGYVPTLRVAAQQLAQYKPEWLQHPSQPHILPFAPFLLSYYEVIMASPDNLHTLIVSYAGCKFSKGSAATPLNILHTPVTGYGLLHFLSVKGLIVDKPVLTFLNMTLPIILDKAGNASPHLNKNWYFYQLMAQERKLLVHRLQCISS